MSGLELEDVPKAAIKGVGWGIENYGVELDLDVDNSPHEEARGEDRQFSAAIEEIQRLLETASRDAEQLASADKLQLPTHEHSIPFVKKR